MLYQTYGGFKSRSAASDADFSAPKVVYFLFEIRLTVVLAQPANSAFGLLYQHWLEGGSHASLVRAYLVSRMEFMRRYAKWNLFA